MPLSHLQHQCGNSQQIHGMGQRRFMHRGSGIHPDHVGIGHFRIGKQCLRKIFTESYLWDLTHKNITGVQIDTNIGSDQGIHHSCRDPLHHIPRSISREHAVHIHIQSRHRPAGHVDSQRIQCRIDIYDSFQILRMLFYSSRRLITDVLSLQFIPVDAGHQTDSG